jgi:hypothetical protein
MSKLHEKPSALKENIEHIKDVQVTGGLKPTKKNIQNFKK